ncbi:uncharacterized protein SPPG_07675 [Spizellomyces punctatus DAOM BR117]|uniref:G-protein coupled receptors family 2 profile 2 domain-containing protein n=1 Tax=Spizellomyces punctatus (strain DAOM BR117) TaxID=645134 RepID=A0A0L0H814_SPIPD|nr:uncharacterized protein SPPG_07675 [Spizellomyces punctatus DAOM BR117]KNC96843.1 hypothetical protein SPPG_07675 [Spizellomyces punctatus DAOM BR117]|eukprot:XP_016604883.1 hypothetical protein SPPG_07675 [Spizellomyces punctatus DAOM BR117]
MNMAPSTNSTGVDDDQWKWDMVVQSVYGSSIVSIIASSLVLVAYGFMYWLRPAQANRISLRLSVIIAFSDIFYALFLLISNIPSVTEGPTCTSSVYLQFAFELLSLFATAAIALNLLMVFVFRMEAKKRLERWYYGVGGVLAFGLPLIALVAGRLGWDEVNEECWIRSANDSKASTMAWKWGILYFWVAGISLFCTVVTILVYFFLKRTGVPLPTTESTPSNPNNTVLFRRTQRIIQRAVSRIVVYCLVPIVSQFWNIVLDGLLEAGKDPWWVYVLANVFSGLQGTFNALVFFTIDPAVSNIREELRRRIIKKYYLTSTVPQTLFERFRYALIQKTLLRKRDLKQPSVINKSSASVLQSETKTRPSQFRSEDVDLVQHAKPGLVESGVAREGEADVIAFL